MSAELALSGVSRGGVHPLPFPASRGRLSFKFNVVSSQTLPLLPPSPFLYLDPGVTLSPPGESKIIPPSS